MVPGGDRGAPAGPLPVPAPGHPGDVVIGYYVHHQGSGHLHRLLAVSRLLRQPLTVLSSLPRPPRVDLPWVRLADDGADPETVVDPDAHGTFQWAPRHDLGLRTRMGQLVAWVDAAGPDLVVVDVSVEVAVQCRLAGVPVAVVARPGDRDDRAHRTAYDLADAILAPWPRGADTGDWPARWRDKTVHVGGFSRFDGWPRLLDDGAVAGPRGLLLWSPEDGPPPEQRWQELRLATPGWTWECDLPDRPLSTAHTWNALCRSDVVVTHAGGNVVAEVAAARTPAVVVASPRPDGEQQHTVRAVDGAAMAVGLPAWPRPHQWPALLAEARRRGGDRWTDWNDGQGAHRTAAALESLSARLGRTSSAGALDA